MTSQFNFKTLFSYSFIAFPIAFASLPVYIIAPEYYANNFDISLATLGLTLFLIRIIDAVAGPVMGYISDKWSEQRVIFILFFGALFVIGFYLIFCPIVTLPLLSFIVGLVFCALSYSFLLVNVMALGALWRHDSRGKVKVSSYRESMTLIGVLAATLLPIMLEHIFNVTIAYIIFSFVFAVILSIGIILFIKWYQSCYVQNQETNFIVSLKTYIQHFSVDQAFFYGVFIISVLAMSSTIVLVNFFVIDYLMLPSTYLGLFLFLYFLSAILAIPFWKYVSEYLGLMNTWLVAMVALIVFFSLGMFLREGDTVLYASICVLTGFTLGAELIIPPSLLAILIDNNKQSSLASGYYALNDFITKFSLAIAGTLLLPLLQYLGFKSNSINQESVLSALLYLYVLIPCTLKLLAIGLLIIWKTKCSKKI